jgi:hypothetical protein
LRWVRPAAKTSPSQETREEEDMVGYVTAGTNDIRNVGAQGNKLHTSVTG